jgi:hypothetical protein
VFTLLIGQITDQTTGQPMRGVSVAISSAHKKFVATTDAEGRFQVTNVPAGNVTLRYSSDDVPPQTLALHVSGSKQSIHITACSVTLDYRCPSSGGI